MHQWTFCILGRFLCFIIVFLNLVNSNGSSLIFNKRCNNSSECAVYPDITQGPDVIWIPLFCNENNVCACPEGWIPLIKNDICINQVSGSSGSTCAGYIWGISFLGIILLAVTSHSLANLFSKRVSRFLQTMKNDERNLPNENSRVK